MSNNNNNNNNGGMTQKGREALERFKVESANELGIHLKNGYNGDLTSREAGSIGGNMVKKMIDSYKQQ
ncbi:MAG: alpha/beta-type small acid-soluble spore protein [Ruminococcus sp.]|nr:alpha/beta-type small acid-soluble spore protein [Ruminococcus sp.]